MASYIPALRFDALTRFFDPVVRVTTRERRFKQLLVAQMGLIPGQRVLDVGCGTATLAIQIANACSGLDVHGVDGDPRVLEVARAKVARRAVAVTLHQALAWELPFPDSSLDRVASSLVFHHLDADAKRRTLAAIHRVLRPGGELHIADWGRAHGPAMRAAFLLVQALDGFAMTFRQRARGPAGCGARRRLLERRRDAAASDAARSALSVSRAPALNAVRRRWLRCSITKAAIADLALDRARSRTSRPGSRSGDISCGIEPSLRRSRQGCSCTDIYRSSCFC